MTALTATSVRDLQPGEATDTITLDETARHRRRMRMTSDGGVSFLLDLPEARLLRHGEALILSDGRIVEVRAEPEALYRVHAKNHRHLLQLAWHLGNRHCSTQIDKETLLIRRDHTLRTMLEGLGAAVEETQAPFNPEGGAYATDHHHD